MAKTVRLKHPATGLVKTGFIGFSWTSFFFGGIPAIMRGDVGIGLGLLAAGLVASAVSAGLLWFVVGLIWAFIYNKRYTTKLIENGYVLDDAPEVVAAAKLALGVVN
jgi:hypothetical protein